MACSLSSKAMVRQQKTGHPVSFELTEQTREAVDAYLRTKKTAGRGFLFPSRRHPDQPMTTRQYARLAKEWVSSICLDASFYGTAFVAADQSDLDLPPNWKSLRGPTGARHTKIESTVRHLGIEVDDALARAEQVDV